MLSALGILNIEKYYDLDPRDIARGIIRHGGKLYKSKSVLTIEDVKFIALEAKNLNRFDSYADWMGSLSGLEEEYKIAVNEHDKALEDYKNTIQNKITTHKEPINKNASFQAHEFKERYEFEMNGLCSQEEKLDLCFRYFKMDKRQELCKDPNHSFLPYPENNCTNLHYHDPYLKLGPFSLEHFNSEPFIEVIHNILFAEEMEWLQKESKGMTRTSYFTKDDKDDDSYNQHTSKTAYHSERIYPELLEKLSQRLELASALNIFNPRYR